MRASTAGGEEQLCIPVIGVVEPETGIVPSALPWNAQIGCLARRQPSPLNALMPLPQIGTNAAGSKFELNVRMYSQVPIAPQLSPVR